MRREVLLLSLAIAAIGCGSTPSNTGNTADANDGRDRSAASTPSTPATPNSTPIVGVKVTAPDEVRFAGSGFPNGWTWIDPTTGSSRISYEAQGTDLKFSIPTGRDLYGVNRSAPRLVKAVEGDFQVEVRVKIDPKTDYQGAGLLVYAGPEKYLRLERGFGGVGGGTNGLRVDVRSGDDYRALTTAEDAPTDATSVELKIVRTGNSFIAFWRLNEDSEWKEVGQYDSDYPASVEVGVIACNTGNPLPVEFSGLKIGPV